jgi:hypothetical protein
MPRARPTPPIDTVVRVPVTFQAGAHALRIAMAVDGRWTVAVDDALVDRRFMTQAEAWEAGVHEAARLDELRGA